MYTPPDPDGLVSLFSEAGGVIRLPQKAIQRHPKHVFKGSITVGMVKISQALGPEWADTGDAGIPATSDQLSSAPAMHYTK